MPLYYCVTNEVFVKQFKEDYIFSSTGFRITPTIFSWCFKLYGIDNYNLHINLQKRINKQQKINKCCMYLVN